MYAVNDEIETIHLYVVREEEKPSYTVLPLLCALLCLAGIVAVTLYSAQHPSYEHTRLTIPARFLPPETFTAAAPIIPTGIKTYPATTAHGILTLTNGSVITQELPRGMIFSGAGAEVITDAAVIVPAGSAAGFGVATVPAHAMSPGNRGNISTLAINAVYGTSLYIRNLHSFTGGRDSYSVPVITQQDRQRAIALAKTSLTAQVVHRRDILTHPCQESIQEIHAVQLTWTCQFVAYPNLPGMRVTAVRLVGKMLFVDVVFVARPRSWRYR